MKPSLKCFWIGLAIYAASFCLVALENPLKVYGLVAAFITSIVPLADLKQWLFDHTSPWRTYNLPAWIILCFPVCGATNPIFLAAGILSLTDSYPPNSQDPKGPRAFDHSIQLPACFFRVPLLSARRFLPVGHRDVISHVPERSRMVPRLQRGFGWPVASTSTPHQRSLAAGT